MSALTAARVKTFQSNSGQLPDVISCRMKGTTTIYAGALVAMNASGYAIPAAAATGLIAVGRAEETKVNSGSDADVRIKVAPGVYQWDNATSTDACLVTDVMTDVYILDDHTVTRTSTGHSKAGKLVDILANGQCLVVTGPGIV